MKMPIDTNGIKNVILDLGGVVVELDPESTLREFIALGFHGLEPQDLIMYPFIEAYETGKIDTGKFLENIQEAIPGKVTKDEISHAWNRLVLDLQDHNLDLIRRLGRQYRVHLLSNTNALHIASFNDRLFAQHGLKDLGEIFEKVYYSFELGMRKPDREIFEYVLKDCRALPEETLYIDDSLEHIESAEGLGIHAYHLQAPEKLTDVLLA